MLVIGAITYWIGFDWNGTITAIISPLVVATDSIPGVLVITFLYGFFWFFGIHGASIVGSVARPLWLTLLEANATAAAAGVPGTELPAIAAEPFFQWFVFIGGAGCTIGLGIMLVTVCKSKYAKDLGRIAFLPCIFNINEPLIFGTPIMLNLTLAIPFVLTPMILGVFAYIVTSLGLVNRVIVSAPWTLPGPIGAFLATGGDWRGAVLCIVCILIALVIYYPFVKIWDKQYLAQESEDSAAVEAA